MVAFDELERLRLQRCLGATSVTVHLADGTQLEGTLEAFTDSTITLQPSRWQTIYRKRKAPLHTEHSTDRMVIGLTEIDMLRRTEFPGQSRHRPSLEPWPVGGQGELWAPGVA